MQQIINRENLDAWELFAESPTRQLVKARAYRLGDHRLARRLQGNEDAYGRVLALHRSHQVANLAGRDMARFHLHQRPLSLARLIVDEGNHAVDALVATLFPRATALLPTQRFGFDQRQRPPLELVAIIASQLPGRAAIFRLAHDLELYLWEHLLQAILL